MIYLKCVGIFFCSFELVNIIYQLCICKEEGLKLTIFHTLCYLLGGGFLWILLKLLGGL